MKNVTKIVILTMYAALSLSSCRKVHITPEETKTPLGFTAVSQTAVVDAKTKALTDYTGSGFGVWGIARHPASENYTLWNNTGFMYASKNASGYYAPEEVAYWIGGYTYRFFACAPYDNGSDMSLTDFTVVPETANTKDAVSFKYDMSNKAYDYDLLGAAAETAVTVGATQGSQQLVFWHLLSKINITISFVDIVDASGAPTNVVNVSEIRLKEVDTKVSYTLSLDSNNQLSVAVEDDGSDNDEVEIVFPSGSGEINVAPQDVSDVVLELDFTIGEGVYAIQTTGYQVLMGSVHESLGISPVYINNQQYNWNITISPKYIIFKPTVQKWGDGGSVNGSIEM